MCEDCIEKLGREIAALRAGADDTPVEEGTMPTAGQWIHIFLQKTGPGRLEMIENMFTVLEVATQCKNYNHETQLRELANKAEVYRLDRDQKAGVLDELSKRARLVTHKKYNIVGTAEAPVGVWCEGCDTLLSEAAALGPEQVIESILNHETEGCPANA